MVYFGLLESYACCPLSLGFGESGEIITFCNVGEELIGEFGVVDDD